MVKAYISFELHEDLERVCRAMRCSESSFIAASLGLHLNQLNELGKGKRQQVKGQIELVEGA
jgi:DNA-binding Xre family transcriptional regulator